MDTTSRQVHANGSDREPWKVRRLLGRKTLLDSDGHCITLVRYPPRSSGKFALSSSQCRSLYCSQSSVLIRVEFTDCSAIYLGSSTQVEQAVGRKAVQQSSLLGYTLANIFSNGLRSKIESLFTANEGALSATFDMAIRKKLIQARAKLDIISLADPIISSAFRQANSLQGIDVASHFVSLFTNVFAVWSQLSLYRLLTRHKRTISYKPILAFTFASSIIQYLRWFILPPKTERSKSTHFAFQRLNEIWSLSCLAEEAASSADMKLLNLQEYLVRHFELASSKLGTLPFMRNVTKPPLQFALEIAAHAWPVLVRTMFAIQALRDPKNVGSLSQLSITILCARKISASISNVFSTLDDLRLDCTKVKAFYDVMELKSRIVEPEMPEAYATQTSHLGSGMKIEFRNVSFGYAGENGPMALKNVSFTIYPGALVCVVGGNGAGKVSSYSSFSEEKFFI